MNERIEKFDMNNERVLDDIYTFKEQIRLVQDDRKRDIEDTADFMK